MKNENITKINSNESNNNYPIHQRKDILFEVIKDEKKDIAIKQKEIKNNINLIISLNKDFTNKLKNIMIGTLCIGNTALLVSYNLSKDHIKRWKRVSFFWLIFFPMNYTIIDFFLYNYPLSMYYKGYVSKATPDDNLYKTL